MLHFFLLSICSSQGQVKQQSEHEHRYVSAKDVLTESVETCRFSFLHIDTQFYASGPRCVAIATHSGMFCH